MTGAGVPKLDPASLDCSDEAPPPYGIERALEHCYYQRDIDGMRRVARQAEQNAAALRARIKQLEDVITGTPIP